MALRAIRPSTGAQQVASTPQVTPTQQVAPAPQVAPHVAPQANTAPAVRAPQVAPAPQVPAGNVSAAISNLNGDILSNIDGLGNAGNFVTMDGSDFYYKSIDLRVKEIDLIITSGKRYYQWVEELGDMKTFHDSDSKLDDRYKLKFEIHWEEEAEEGEITTPQFHMPTASAMRFIDYVKALAQAGYGVGNVVTRMTISRQTQKNSTNRYSRAEFTMIGFVNQNNEIVEVANGISTVTMK